MPCSGAFREQQSVLWVGPRCCRRQKVPAPRSSAIRAGPIRAGPIRAGLGGARGGSCIIVRRGLSGGQPCAVPLSTRKVWVWTFSSFPHPPLARLPFLSVVFERLGPDGPAPEGARPTWRAWESTRDLGSSPSLGSCSVCSPGRGGGWGAGPLSQMLLNGAGEEALRMRRAGRRAPCRLLARQLLDRGGGRAHPEPLAQES